MKNSKTFNAKGLKISVAFCLIKLLTSAQPYAETNYSHAGAILSSGAVAPNNANPGYIMAGYKPGVILGNANFYIDKTDNQGGFSGLGASFKTEYQIFSSNSCIVNPPQSLICRGVTVIENTLATDPYALAGAVNNGCFFATLDNAGNPVQQMFYPFPSLAFAPSKPLIIENPAPNSGSNSGFLICGSYSLTNQGRYMYVISIDQIGNVIQSNTFLTPLGLGQAFAFAGYEYRPTSICLNPFAWTPSTQPELIIVGEAALFYDNTLTTLPAYSAGFFMRLNANNLTAFAAAPATLFDYTTSGPQRNYFNSVTPSFFPGTEGYIIGGYSDLYTSGSSPGSNSWVMKVDASGNFQYSNILTSSFDPTSGEVNSVIERHSPTYGYTTYGAVRSANGLLCIKLEESIGQPFTSTTPIDDKNEFLYANGSNLGIAKGISFLDNGSTWGQGIHVYGDANNIDSYFVQAAFNGYTEFGTCSSSSTNNLLTAAIGPVRVSHHPAPQGLGLTACHNFVLSVTQTNPQITTLCSASSLVAGSASNARPALTTKINNTDTDLENSIQIFPNPSNGIITISSAVENEQLKVKILDVTGKVVYSKALKNNESNTLDVSSLKSSIYFIEIQNSDNKIVRKKLIIE